MELEKVRKLGLSDLHKEISKTQKKIVETRSEVLMHRIKNHRSLGVLKKYLAKLLTVKSERALLKIDTASESENV